MHRTSKRCYDSFFYVKERLDALGFVEGKHYLLLDVQQQVPSGTKHTKVYYLTPEAFFLALQRAHKWTIHFFYAKLKLKNDNTPR